MLSNVRTAQHGQTLGIGGHDTVLNAVMNHFDEVAGAVWPAMEIALLGGAAAFFEPAGVRGMLADARSQRRKNWIEVLDDVRLTANHHAVTTLQPPNTAARPHVYIMDTVWREFFGAPDIVNVVRIAAVDQNVVLLKMGQKIRDTLVHDGGGTINQTARGLVSF